MSASTSATSFRPGELAVHPDGTGNLLACTCSACGTHFFPVREACAACLSQDLTTVELATEGILYTYTIIRQSTPQFETPYALGYVDFPEGVRIMGQICDTAYDEIAVGMPMELIIEPWPSETGSSEEDGTSLAGYRFRPKATTP